MYLLPPNQGYGRSTTTSAFGQDRQTPDSDKQPSSSRLDEIQANITTALNAYSKGLLDIHYEKNDRKCTVKCAEEIPDLLCNGFTVQNIKGKFCLIWGLPGNAPKTQATSTVSETKKTDLDQKPKIYFPKDYTPQCITSDGKWGLLDYGFTVYLWNVQDNKEQRRFCGHTGAVWCAALSSDGKLALTGSSDKTVRLWNCQTGEQRFCFQGHSNSICSVALSSDGTLALSGSNSKTVRLWDCETGKVRFCFKGHSNSVRSVAFSRDGEWAISGSEDKTVRIWNCQTGKEHFCFKGHSNRVLSVAFNFDGTWAISGSKDGTVRMWNCQDGNERFRYEGLSDGVTSVTLSPNGRLALVGDEHGVVDLLDCQSGTKLHSFCDRESSVKSIAFSPDGKGVVSTDENGVRFLNIERFAIQSADLEPRLRTVPVTFPSKITKATSSTASSSRSVSARPTSITAPISDPDKTEQSADASSSSASSSSSIAAPTAPTNPSQNVLFTALYEHTAGDEDQLSVKTGELVQVLVSDPDWEALGWYYCQKGDAKGYVPKIYLQEFLPSENPTAAPSSATSLAAFTDHMQKTCKDDQELAKEIVRQVEAISESLSSQTPADYQALLRDLKQDMQKLLEANVQQHIQHQKEIDHLTTLLGRVTETECKALKKQIFDLEQNQALLMQEYNAQLASLAEKELILNQQKMARFYRTAQNKLQQIFLAYKVIGSGLVVNTALTNTVKTIQAISLAGEAIPLPGSHAVATWLRIAIEAGSWAAQKHTGNSDKNRINNLTELVVSFNEIDILTETTSRTLTLMYKEQLLLMTTDSAGVLAEAAVKLMVAYLWAGEYQDKQLNEQLIASVARVHPHNQAQGLWQQVCQTVSELKGKFKDSNITTTQTGVNWTAFGVFHRPGLKTASSPNEFFYSGNGTKPEIYGYRLGTQEEAQAAGLKQTNERTLLHVLADKTLSQSDKKQLRNVTDDTKAMQSRAELQASQFHHEQERRAKIELKVEAIERQLSSTRSETESIKDVILITDCKVCITWSSISKEKYQQLDELLQSHAEDCNEKHVERNASKHIVALTFPNKRLVEILKGKLVATLGLST